MTNTQDPRRAAYRHDGASNVKTLGEKGKTNTETRKEDVSTYGAPEGGETSVQTNTYVKLLAHRPWLVALLALLLGLTCVILSFAVIPIPDFSDPVKGFNSRGTTLGIKTRTLQNAFFAAVKDEHDFSMSPNMALDTYRDSIVDLFSETTKNLKVVFQSALASGDLFNLQSFQSMCSIEAQLHLASNTGTTSQHDCVNMMSIPLLAMINANKATCSALTEPDVSALKELLTFCYPYYKHGKITESCKEPVCLAVPDNCTHHSIAYNVFHYLADVDFDPASIATKLSYSMMIFGTQPKNQADYYTEVFGRNDVGDGVVKVVSVYANDTLRVDVFAKYFIMDILMYLLGLGACCMFVILFLYLFSFVILISTALNIAFSFALANVVYFYIFQIKFFPFINILAAIVLLAVGVDAVFIFHDAWEQCAKNDKGDLLERRIADTFSHVGMSIMVTSLTTACSFFSSYITNIVSIQCFAIFSGLCVLANFLFLMTWIPAIIVCQTIFSPCLTCPWEHSEKLHKLFITITKIRSKVSDFISYAVLSIIGGYWYVCVLLLFVLGIGGIVCIFYYPKLEGPQSSKFSLFTLNNYLDTWQSGVSDQFRYFKEENTKNVTVYFIWGVTPQDNGHWYDSYDLGSLLLDDKFDFIAPESQLWFRDFHGHIRNHSLYSETSADNPNYLSLFELFEVALKDCVNVTSTLQQVGCCSETKLPFSRWFMKKCFTYIYISASVRNVLGTDGMIAPVFNASNHVKALGIRLNTSRSSTESHAHMANVSHELNAFLNSELVSAPASLSGGFVASGKDFIAYDLYMVLSTGTYFSVLLSLLAATIFMFVTSMNPLLTLYAVTTIVLAISTTAGCLTLMGWELNVVESITMSLAVGLSVDFTIHYGIAYRLSGKYGSGERTAEAFERVGLAVLMAAATTFTAGASMLPSHILAYTKLGTFLVLIMCFSWIYATFFFLSLCHAIGPTGNFCQIRLKCCSSQVGHIDYIHEEHCEGS